MKSNLSYLLIFFFLFGNSCSNPRPALEEAIYKFRECHQLEDYDCISYYMLPSIIKHSGGLEEYSDGLSNQYESLNNRGIRINISDIVFSNPDTLTGKNEMLFSVISTHQDVIVFGKNGIIISSFIGVSSDKGKTWFFVEGNNIGRTSLNSMAPGILQDINLKIPTMIVGEYKIRKKNNLWQIPPEMTGNSWAIEFERCFNERDWDCLNTFLLQPLARLNYTHFDDDVDKALRVIINNNFPTSKLLGVEFEPGGLRVFEPSSFIYQNEFIYSLFKIHQSMTFMGKEGVMESHYLLVYDRKWGSWFVIMKGLQKLYTSGIFKSIKQYNIPEPRMLIGTKIIKMKDNEWIYPKNYGIQIERKRLIQDINNIASSAASYWRKPAALGGGARSFIDVTDVTTFGADSSNANGIFRMSEVFTNQFSLVATGRVSQIKLKAIITQKGVKNSIVKLN